MLEIGILRIETKLQNIDVSQSIAAEPVVGFNPISSMIDIMYFMTEDTNSTDWKVACEGTLTKLARLIDDNLYQYSADPFRRRDGNGSSEESMRGSTEVVLRFRASTKEPYIRGCSVRLAAVHPDGIVEITYKDLSGKSSP